MKKIRKKRPKFDPGRLFDSPEQAIRYARKQRDPAAAVWAIAKANVEMGEFGFAGELVTEMQTL